MPLSATEVRRINFTAAVDSAGGVEPFCKKFEMNPDYVRQLLRGSDGKESSGRNIGSRSARSIEARLGMAENQLDQAPMAAAEMQGAEADDLESVRYVLAALFTTLAFSRPDEVPVVARALKSAPERLQAKGLIPELLGVLEPAPKARRAGARVRAQRPSPASP